MRKRLVILFAILTTVGLVWARPGKKALKLISKQKFEKAEKVLNKGLEKDTLAPAIHYAFATLYFDSAYVQVHLDSAYYHILRAEGQLPLLESKERDKLAKIPVDSTAIGYLKDRIDSAAFTRTASAHTEEAYQTFFLTHTDANQRAQAESLRNELAFAEAVRLNTYESYNQFVEKYPEAPQVREAGELYEIRLFEVATRDKTLEQFTSFINKYPSSPYLEEARRNVFLLETLDGRPESFASFVRQYPQSHWAAVAGSYYTYLTGRPPAEATAGLYDSLSAMVQADSLPIFPVWEGNTYAFYYPDGNKVSGFRADALPDDYLCGGIMSQAVIGFAGDTGRLYTRAGQSIAENVDESEPLDGGNVLFRRGDYYGVVNLEGRPILPPVYDDVAQAGSFLVTDQRGKAGLYSLAGRVILPEEYDRIQVEGSYILATRANEVNLYFSRDLLALAEGRPVEGPAVTRNRINREKQIQIWLQNGQMAVYDSSGTAILPPAGEQISAIHGGWLAHSPEAFRLMRYDGSVFIEGSADSLLYNQKWLAIRTDSGWNAIYLSVPSRGVIPAEAQFDSLNLVGKSAVNTYKDGKRVLYLSPDHTIDVGKGQDVRVLMPQSAVRGIAAESDYVVQLSNERGYVQLYNSQGQKIKEGLLSQVEALTDSLVSIRTGRRFQLLSTSGKEVLPARYDGFQLYPAGSLNTPAISTLRGSRFGKYLSATGHEISARYERLLRAYDGNLWVGIKKGKAGLIDPAQGEVTSFVYEDIRPWNDSLFLGKKESRWNLYTLKEETPVYRDMTIVRPFGSTGDDKRYLVMAGREYGVLSTTEGEILQPAFDEIVNVGTSDTPVYFAEKEVKEADVSVVVWYDSAGNILVRKTYSPEDLERLYCD